MRQAARRSSRRPLSARAPSSFGNRMSHAAMCSTPASRRPEASRLSGFAEDPMKQRRGLLLRHVGKSLRWTRLIEPLDVTTTRVCVPSPTRSLSSNASTRNSTVRPSTLVTTARRAQAHADRRRRVMPDIEMRAETLVARRQQPLDGVERGRLHQVDHHGRGQHAHPAAADARRGVLLAATIVGGAGQAFFECGEVRHGPGGCCAIARRWRSWSGEPQLT